MPCPNRSFGCSEPVQTAAISRSSKRPCLNTNVLLSDLVALPAGFLPPGLLWTSGSNQHHKHFRNCSYHRKHKPLCHGFLRSSLHPLDDRRSAQLFRRRRADGSRLASTWSRLPSIIARNSQEPFPDGRVPTTNLKGLRAFLTNAISTSVNQQQQQQQQQQPPTSSRVESASYASPCDLNQTCDNVVIVSDDDDVLSHLLLSRSSQSLNERDDDDDDDDDDDRINHFLLRSFSATQLLS